MRLSFQFKLLSHCVTGSDPLAQENERGGVTGAHFLARDRACAKKCVPMTRLATTGAHCLAEAPRIAVWWPEARPQMHISWQNREQGPRNAALWSRGMTLCSTSRNPTPSLSPKAPTAATAGQLLRQGVVRRVTHPDCIAGHGCDQSDWVSELWRTSCPAFQPASNPTSSPRR